jgi:hypothetical protein
MAGTDERGWVVAEEVAALETMAMVEEIEREAREPRRTSRVEVERRVTNGIAARARQFGATEVVEDGEDREVWLTFEGRRVSVTVRALGPE